MCPHIIIMTICQLNAMLASDINEEWVCGYERGPRLIGIALVGVGTHYKGVNKVSKGFNHLFDNDLHGTWR